MEGLDEAVALVTGAGASATETDKSGIGREAATRLGSEGTTVVCSDIVEEGARETADMVEAGGGDAIAVQTDVTEPGQVESLVEKTVDQYGGLDIALNCPAEIGPEMPLAEPPSEGYDEVIETTLTSVYYSMKYELPPIVAGGGGTIVNFSSGAGLGGFPTRAPYSAAKHGILGLTRSAALEYAPDDVRVNAVCPFAVDSSFFARASDEEREFMRNRSPVDRLAEPKEIANVAVFLCSDDASYVSGHPFVVDAGAMARS
jgi:NAD(P)-dependent dehydrogenase (short-subunit alcohol dehydrogenase family)